jgi:hypothetical protein
MVECDCGAMPPRNGLLESSNAVTAPILTKAQLARYIRGHVDVQLYDDSGVLPQSIAIYSLSDPRDIRCVRYVGQTTLPTRRFLQHLNTARLWLPEERPWWVKSPKLRPLYNWIRELYRDELRLPTMVISAWVNAASDARLAERVRIFECLAKSLPLLNVENFRTSNSIAAAQLKHSSRREGLPIEAVAYLRREQFDQPMHYEGQENEIIDHTQ